MSSEDVVVMNIEFLEYIKLATDLKSTIPDYNPALEYVISVSSGTTVTV